MSPRKISKSVDTATEAVADRASDAAKQTTATTKLKGFKKMSAGAASEVTEVIPSTMEVLNRWVLGCGGWPVKRVSEVFSDPSAGKTSLCADAMGQCAKAGGTPILVEIESSIIAARFKVLGCDPDDVWLDEPMTIEEALDSMRNGLLELPPKTGPNFMALDSIGAGSLKSVMDKGQKASTMGRKAAFISEHLPPLVRMCVEKRTHLMLINHASRKLGVVFGDPTTTPGGNKAKFAASIRLQLWAGSKVKVGGAKVGISPTIACVKNKLAIPHHKAKLRLMFETGWDNTWSIFNLAKDLGVLPEGLDATGANLQRARAALGWYAATADEVAAWAASDAELAETAKAKKKNKKAAVAEAEEGLFSTSGDWDGDGDEEDA